MHTVLNNHLLRKIHSNPTNSCSIIKALSSAGKAWEELMDVERCTEVLVERFRFMQLSQGRCCDVKSLAEFQQVALVFNVFVAALTTQSVRQVALEKN